MLTCGCGRLTISVESSGGRNWYRLRLGGSVVADKMFTEAELVRELVRYGHVLADFAEPDPPR